MIPASTFSADALLAELTEWVRIESPTYEAATVNRMEDLIASRIGALGFSVERVPGRDGLGDILRCRRAGRSNGPGILIIAHADTVHPVGTLADKLPIRREGDKCYGPAIYDMKGGTVLALAALKAVMDSGRLNLPVTIVINPDEEIGSPTSRALIEEEARNHKYVLIPEPAKGERGDVTTGRHAFQRFFLTTHGRPAHSGWTNKDGRSAVRVMAQIIEELESRSDFEKGPDLRGQRRARGAVGELRADDLHGAGTVRVARPRHLRRDRPCPGRPRRHPLRRAHRGRARAGQATVGGARWQPWRSTSARAALPATSASISATASTAAARTATSRAPWAWRPSTVSASWAPAPTPTRSTSWSRRWCPAPPCSPASSPSWSERTELAQIVVDVGSEADLHWVLARVRHSRQEIRDSRRIAPFGEMEGRRPLHPYEGWGAANAARRRAQVQRAALRIEQERTGIAPRTWLRAERTEAQQTPPIAAPPQVLERAGRAIGGQLSPRRHRSRVRPHRCAPL